MKRIAAVTTGVFLSFSAQADLWGVESTVGVMPGISQYQSKEPEGNTDWKAVVYPITLSATASINPITRVVFGFRYADFDIPADADEIGVTVEGYQFSSVLQRQWRLSRHFKPWFGAGVGSAVLDFSDRYRTDADGFLVERLSDRSETSMGVLVTAGMDWELARSWSAAVEATYEYPLMDSLHGYGITAGIRYHF